MLEELDEDGCLEAFYNGISPSKIYAPNVRYNEQAAKLGLELIPEQPEFSEEWYMPDFYKQIDLVQFFSDKITTEEEIERVALELSLFQESNSENLLRYAIYLGEVIRKNNIVTGVGRGSSVSVYTLYLCGLHKVNSLFYNLSPYEFFKIKGE